MFTCFALQSRPAQISEGTRHNADGVKKCPENMLTVCRLLSTDS